MDDLSNRLTLLSEKVSNITRAAEEFKALLAKNDDIFFLVTMAMIVFFMQSGFAFLEAGSVRSKNVTNILMKNVLVTFITAALYWICGYAFAFGEPSNPFIGYNYFFLSNLPMEKYHHWLFQYTFAATASTIVSGAVAERCEFSAFIIYSCFINAWVYPVLSHWVWAPSGWLAGLGGSNGGFHDFAGGGVVHLCGGTIALIANLFLGPRYGRFPQPGQPNVELKGHSMPLCVVGTFIIAFGFLAFNGGSQGSISNVGDGTTVALAVINTILAGTFGVLSSLLISKRKEKRWSLSVTCNGCLVGMVSACPGCNVIYPWAGSLTGFVAGAIFSLSSSMIVKLKIDDPLDAFPVHFTGGLVGLLAAPIFNFNKGIVYFGDRKAFMGFAWNLSGIFIIIIWCCLCTIPLFALLKKFQCLRVSKEIEIRGLDIFKHKEPAYPIIAYGHGWNELFTAEDMRFLLFPREVQGIAIQEILSGSFQTEPQDAPIDRLAAEKITIATFRNKAKEMIKAKRLPSLTRKHQISPQKIVSQPAEDKIAVIDREELDSRKSIENGVNDTTNKLDKTEENAESISISLVKGEKEIRHENP